MNELAIQAIVEEVLQRLQRPATEKMIPIAVSARHCHLSSTDLELLFGMDYELTKKADLSQPGQFAAKETVTIVGPKGSIERVRILGPARSLTQVEVSRTDSIKLGVKAPIRQSGDIKGSAPITIVGPKGSIYLKEGLIVAQAHIHMNEEDATRFHVTNGEYVSIKADTERPFSFEKVLIRVSPRYKLEMHIDTDEANACAISGAVYGRLRKHEGDSFEAAPRIELPSQRVEETLFEGKLLTQREVQDFNGKILKVKKKTLITPLAHDAARDLGKTIEIIDEKGE